MALITHKFQEVLKALHDYLVIVDQNREVSFYLNKYLKLHFAHFELEVYPAFISATSKNGIIPIEGHIITALFYQSTCVFTSN